MKNILSKIQKSMTNTPKDEKDEVEEFLKKNPIFPCFLISKDKGKIDTIKDGFEKENIPIQKIKENSFIELYQESKEDFQMILDKKISEDISLYGTLKFDAYINRNEEGSSSKKYMQENINYILLILKKKIYLLVNIIQINSNKLQIAVYQMKKKLQNQQKKYLIVQDIIFQKKFIQEEC